MVGYNEKKLVDFLSIMDNYTVEEVGSKTKVRASMYKLMITEPGVMETYKKELFSMVLMLTALHYKKMIKFEKETYGEIAIKVISHELNRALYQQDRMKDSLTRNSEVPAVQLLSMDSIGEAHYGKVLALLMVNYGLDLQDLVIDSSTAKKFLDKNLFLGDSFATMEEVIDASGN